MLKTLPLRLSLILSVLITITGSWTATASPWKETIEQASPGSTVEIPAGVHQMADVHVPEGVVVRGAGYDQTIIDAASGTAGLLVGAGSEIHTLTVRGAPQNGIHFAGPGSVRISGVRVERCLTGIAIVNAADVRIENSILYQNRTALALSRIRGGVVVNNTLYNNNSLGLSLVDVEDVVAFNNVVLNSATAIFLGEHTNLLMDHNLYLANFIGNTPGQRTTISVQRWRDLVGQDAHSFQEIVAFVDAEAGRYEPSTRLSWHPGRTPLTGFGVVRLGDASAPVVDALGAARDPEHVDLGAIQFKVPEPERAPAGSFTVQEKDRVVSAGMFTSEGVLVSYLFQNLPLRPGKYDIWIPAHDWQGLEIPAGTYEVRLVESGTGMEYLGLVFNTAHSSNRKDHDSYHAKYAAFEPDGGIILGCGWSESHLQIRTFDAAYEEAGWTVKGSSEANGMALDGQGHLYFLGSVGRDEDPAVRTLSLSKVDLGSGAVLPVTETQAAPVFTDMFSPLTDGLAVLNGRFYISDLANNRILHTPVQAPTFADRIEMTAPQQVVADRINNLLWVISGERDLVALQPDGQVVYKHAFPHRIDRLSVANGRLAVLSRETGKIEILEITSPKQLTSLRILGTGRDPFGKFEPKTFTFKGRENASSVALGENGELLVIDAPRTLLFDAEGKPVRQTISAWGQHLVQGRLAGDEQPRWWNVDSDYSITMDSRSGTWQPDGLWHFPQPGLVRYRRAVDFFHDGTRNFALFSGSWQDPQFTMLEFDGYKGKAVAIWRPDPKAAHILTLQTDTNGDGIIDENDAPARAVATDENNHWRYTLGSEHHFYIDHATRDLWFAGVAHGQTESFGLKIPYLGLDEDGIPSYDWDNGKILKSLVAPHAKAEYISPFDHKTLERINVRVGEFAEFSDGTIAFSTVGTTGGGKGMGHVAGSDLAAAGPDGQFRWFHPLPLAGGIHGIQVQDDILVTQNFTDMDWHMFNRDGLGLGIAGIPKEMYWTGMWNDHPRQYRLFKGNDGEIYAVLGDYVVTGFHHFHLTGADTIREQTIPVSVSVDLAKTLASQLRVPVPSRIEPPVFNVTISRLEKPLPIDGDLAKWREAGIPPQILMTPETARGDISGPDDLSGIVRLAHEGGNLYVQVIKFDDVVTMHQPLAKHYLQDSVEFAINGYLQGFKFNVTRTIEHGDTVLRDRFHNTKLNRVFTPEEAPRVIKVLDNASDVEERKLIESIYGTSLQDTKVIITEFKLPLELVFRDSPEWAPKGKSGETAWIGIMLDDNDEPGSDTQDLLVFPATYGTHAVKERGALATFE